MTDIGSGAFFGCNDIQSIYCLDPIPPTCKYLAFDEDVYTYSILHVPVGSYYTYSSAFNWRHFKRIKDDIESTNSINDIRQSSESVVYDLQGRRAEQPQRGLYIRDGKKIIIR